MHLNARNTSFVTLVGLACLAACQPMPGNPPIGGTSSPPPSTQESPSGTPVPATAAPGASLSPSEATTRLTVLSGKIFDDDGLLVRTGRVQISSSELPSLNRELDAQGGTYVVQDVPIGTVITLRATAAGYTVRERTIRVPEPAEPGKPDPYEFNFGGDGEEARYAISQYPEIVAITPANLSKGVSTNPLVMTFKLSHPLAQKDRDQFAKLLQIRFQVPGGELILQHGTLYNEVEARLTWNAAGDEATFRFDAPIVTRAAEAAAVTVGLDDSVSLDQWPSGTNGKLLGRERVQVTTDAAGVSVRQRIAPFVQPVDSVGLPSPRPSALTLWGLTHRLNSVFTLAPDSSPPRVVSVTGYRGINGGQDRIAIVFDEPMRGYPEASLDGSALRPSNYRYILGKMSTTKDAEAFEKSDPVTQGGTTPLALYYSTSNFTTVNLPLPAGTLENYTDLKVYVDPAVKDLAGNGVKSSAQNPMNSLADHVLKGRII